MKLEDPLGALQLEKKNFLEVHKSRIFSSGGKKARSTYFAICRYVTSFLLRNLTIHSASEIRVVQTKYSGLFVSIVIWVLEYFVIEILELFWEVVIKE